MNHRLQKAEAWIAATQQSIEHYGLTWVEPQRHELPPRDKLRVLPEAYVFHWKNEGSPDKREIAIHVEEMHIRYARRAESGPATIMPDGEITEDIFFLLWHWLFSSSED